MSRSVCTFSTLETEEGSRETPRLSPPEALPPFPSLFFRVENISWVAVRYIRMLANPNIEQIGEPLTMDDLPPPNIRRWITRRKAEVVTAVRIGLLSLDEACLRYDITLEEFFSWQRLLDEHGLQGLRVTRLQEYRHLAKGEGMADAQSADMGAPG